VFTDDKSMMFRVLQLTCAHCGTVERSRCRETGQGQVLQPCNGCGRPRAIGTNIVATKGRIVGWDEKI
jgi:hypothetical protein